MTQQSGQQRAREAVLQRMKELGLSQRRMSAEVGISTNTIARFVSGTSWPRAHQIASMERALGWSTGSIEKIANGEDIGQTDEFTPDRVAVGDHGVTFGDTHIDPDDGLALIFTPGYLAGLSPEDRDEAITRGKLAVQEFVRALKTRA